MYAMQVLLHVHYYSQYCYSTQNRYERLGDVCLILPLGPRSFDDTMNNKIDELNNKVDEVDTKMDEMAKQLNDLKSILAKITAPGRQQAV